MVRLPRQHKAELCARAGRGRGQELCGGHCKGAAELFPPPPSGGE
ncbi:hypothetical protein [Azospirillum endophyticum]